MVPKTQLNAARTSPIPGVVVIVLAVVVVLFGVAVVKRPSQPDPAFVREIVALREQVEGTAKERARLERRVNQWSEEIEAAQESVSQLESENQALRASLQELDAEHASLVGASAPVQPSLGANEEGPSGVDPAEFRALERRARAAESELRALRAQVEAQAVAQAAATASAQRAAEHAVASSGAAEDPDRSQSKSEVPAHDAVAVDPSADDVEGPMGADQAQSEAPTPAEVDPLAVARIIASEHAALLAPFFDSGCEQPDGSRTASPGPMSLSALFASGALEPPTAEVLEQNPGLRKLAEFASNAPNDRTLWPYTRGSRARVWYMREDGRQAVPLAQELLRQHGEAFVQLGLLAQ
ncbi:MAG: hypothetical protein R3F49_06835 [Planctomycetota bacterium]